MKLRFFASHAAIVALLLAGTSCLDDWGQADPPAGNQVYPTLQKAGELNFDEVDLNDASVFTVVASTAGQTPEIVQDAVAKSSVLQLNQGTVSYANPLAKLTCQKAASFTLWMHQPMDKDEEGNTIGEQDITSPIITFVNQAGTVDEPVVESKSRADAEPYTNYGSLSFNANGDITYNTTNETFTINVPSAKDSVIVAGGDWHYLAVTIHDTGYSILVDGVSRANETVVDFDMMSMVEFINNASTVQLGSTEAAQQLLVDDVNIYRNALSEKETKQPKKGAIGTVGGEDEGFEPIIPVYFNSFDGDNKDVTIHGAGEFKYVGGQWGTVYSNGMDGKRQNYLVLPSNVLSQCNDEALAISVWVNRGNETNSDHYMWSPLISAYGVENTESNTWPMFVAQYRGVLQTNCGGTWTDYTDSQNEAGINTAYHSGTDWLADGKWHNYTAVITPTHAVVYFDGEVANEWKLDGNTSGGSAAGLLSANNEISWICLGGNQAWDWGDPDPGFWFDDIAIYNQELSQETVKTLIAMKNTNYTNTFSNGAGDATLVGDGTFIDNSTPKFGKIFKNAVGGTRQNYLKVPATALSGVETTEAMTVAMWVNSTDAGDYYWNPLVTAYGDNGTNNPTFALQYRGIIAINTEAPDNTGAEFCDFGNELHDNGAVVLYHGDLDWLADKEWHFYTAVFDGLHFTVYFDGEVANSWTIDGVSRGQICNYQSFTRLTNICICGNQQWDWGDPDPGFGIDDVMFYNRALTPAEIKQLMLWKK